MAGTLPNLPLSQQFDPVTAKFLSGGRLYFYRANTSTPQTAYQDYGLTLTHPNPIVLASDGRIPSFFLADGSIRVRLTDKNGVPLFDEQNLLVIGPSSGTGGGGGGVDATTIFQTGDVMWLDQDNTRTGWVRDNGRTIGSSTSGSTERANADCLNLFEWCWNNFGDSVCPVISGRGASASADWAANKQLTLPDKRFRSAFGLDDMGNTAAGRATGVPFTLGNSLSAGSLGGEARHTMLTAELPSHTHGAGTLVADAHSHTYSKAASSGTEGGASGAAWDVTFVTTNTSSTGPLTVTGTSASTGSGSSHNNMPMFVLGTFYRKL